METISSATSFPLPRGPASYDEFSMQQSLLFSDSLKDLKNLRKQLYSAAEYFELSYTNDDQKQIVVDTLKDYVIKALVNTVDHLGAVTYKVNDLLDEKVDEVSGTELRVSSIEQLRVSVEDVQFPILIRNQMNQRLRTCQGHIDNEGLSQQSSVINVPKLHKRYILPVGETMIGSFRTKLKYQGCNLDDEDDWHEFKNAVRATIRETPPSSARRGCSPPPSPRPSQQPGSFSFAGSKSMPNKDLEKRAVSPHRFPLLRTGSLASAPTNSSSRSNSRSTTPNHSRPTTPNSVGRQRYPSEPRKSASMRLHPEKDTHRESDQIPSKSKRLLKALLSRRKSKKDDMLYTYLDEY